MTKNGKLYVLSGSSGVGKGTLIKKFLEKNPDIKLSVSYTTRAPRPGEIDGVNYFFVTKEDFEKAVENNEFLEWANFSGNYYGTNANYVENALSNGEKIILEIDTQGAIQIMKRYPEAEYIFILPPSLKDLESRLRGRGTETEEAIQKRLSAVKKELEISKSFKHLIVNDNIDEALDKLQKVFNGERNVSK